MPGNRILIVDDDPDLINLLSYQLINAGYLVSSALEGTAGLERLAQESVDLIILDLMMPGLDGWEVVRRLRDRHHTPVLILSARDQVEDYVRSLDGGADGYLTKPFSKSELLARVRALLRRSPPVSDKPGRRKPPDDGRLRIDPDRRRAYIGNRPIDLDPTEFSVLAALFEHRGRSLSFEQILEQVWGPAYTDSPSYVHVYIARIRRKLKNMGYKRQVLVNERGFGYRLLDK